MAVAKMKKVTIFASRELKGSIFELLRDLEIMEVTKAQESRGQQAGVPEHIQEKVDRLSHIVSYLQKYNPSQKGFIDMFTGSKPEVSFERLQEMLDTYEIESAHREVLDHEQRLKSIDQETGILLALKEQLEPWVDFTLPLGRLGETVSTRNLLAIVSPSIFSDLEDTRNNAIHVETVWEDKGKVGIWVLYAKDRQQEVLSLVSSAGGSVVEVTLPDTLSGKTARECILKLDEMHDRLLQERDRIENRDKHMSQDLTSILALWDHYQDQGNLASVAECTRKTTYTLLVEGFVKARDVPGLRNAFSGMSEIEIIDEDPGPKDEVPVYLENHPLIRPFEVITNIFGFPKYTEVDPTPVLAPFFWVFFGICLGDAVYGILLALGCWLFLRTQRLEDGGQKMVRLLMYSGISTIIMGALMGSWLADLPSVFLKGTFVERFANKVAVLDPIGDPLTLLGISFVLGIFQVWVGIIVNMYGLIISGQVAEGIISQGSWVVFLAGLVATLASQAGFINSPLPLYIAILGALMVMYSASRNQKNILLKPFAGLYGLYDVVGYFSDTMSYSRLLALGLASAVVGVVVNKIAELVVNMIPVVGWVFVPIVLLGGHVFNLVINVLGSFIHSGRLQFVEFFTKFFEGGGRPFKPLKRVSDSVWLS